MFTAFNPLYLYYDFKVFFTGRSCFAQPERCFREVIMLCDLCQIFAPFLQESCTSLGFGLLRAF